MLHAAWRLLVACALWSATVHVFLIYGACVAVFAYCAVDRCIDWPRAEQQHVWGKATEPNGRMLCVCETNDSSDQAAGPTVHRTQRERRAMERILHAIHHCARVSRSANEVTAHPTLITIYTLHKINVTTGTQTRPCRPHVSVLLPTAVQ